MSLELICPRFLDRSACSKGQLGGRSRSKRHPCLRNVEIAHLSRTSREGRRNGSFSWGVLREGVMASIGVSGLIRRAHAHAAAYWNDRLAPWLLGDFAKDETGTCNRDTTTIQLMKAAVHSCLGSTGRSMRKNWYRMLASRFRNNRTR